jgi:hypothetical protein
MVQEEQTPLSLAPTTAMNGVSSAEDLLTPSIIKLDTATPPPLSSGSKKVSPRSVVPITDRVDDAQTRSSEPSSPRGGAERERERSRMNEE